MHKYIQVLKGHIINSLEFRGQVFGFVLTWIITTLSFIVLLLAIYKDGNSLGQYGLGGIVFYYLAILFVSFITESYIGQELAGQVRKGELSKYLLKPYNLFWEKLAQALGSKTAYIILPIPLYILFVIVFFKLIMTDLQVDIPRVEYIIFGIVFCWLGFVLNFILEYLAAGFAFFMDETWSISHFKHITLTILGGASFPLDIIQGKFADIVDLLPFKYVYYIPVSYITGRRSITEYFMEDVTLFIFWLVLIYLITKLIWHIGLKRYGAYGN